MFKGLFIISTVLIPISPSAFASDHDYDVAWTDKAARVFKENMDTPDKGIPHDLLKSAKCIAIIPGDVKFAFIFGANYGRGVAACRTAKGGARRCLSRSREEASDFRSAAPPQI